KRRAPPRAAGLARSRRSAMRLLPKRDDHGGGRAARGEAAADRCGDRRRHHQYLPLRHLPAHPRRDPRRRRPAPERSEPAARRAGAPSGRRFPRAGAPSLPRAAPLGAARALGFDFPLGPPPAHAATSAPEITAWIVIEPDETVIIRIAKSEMGQGSFTALPMLVAEELECDWSKVKAEFAPPHENRKRDRVWGNMSTGASRSLSRSQNDLRRAGATARAMLIAAAAAQWNVPVAECTAAQGVITHRLSGRRITYGRIAAAAADIAPPTQIALKDPKDWKLIG